MITGLKERAKSFARNVKSIFRPPMVEVKPNTRPANVDLEKRHDEELRRNISGRRRLIHKRKWAGERHKPRMIFELVWDNDKGKECHSAETFGTMRGNTLRAELNAAAGKNKYFLKKIGMC